MPVPAAVRIIQVVLIGLALIAFFGLDWTQWKKGESSYLFSKLLRVKEKGPPKEENLSQILSASLAHLDIPLESIDQFEDESGNLHLMVDLPVEKFNDIENDLETTLTARGFRILKREEQSSSEKILHLWEVGGKKEQKLAVLFSSRKESPKIAEKPAVKPFLGRVAIIVDDMGYSLDAIDVLSSIGQPLTVAIIPYSPYAMETATISRRNNIEVILHLPLESIAKSDINNVEGMIYAGMSDKDIIATVEKDLDQVPFIQGVNNHMGSRITADTRLMRIILGRLKARNLFFIDSRTTGSTVAYQVAQSLGIPTAFRHVFLDGEPEEAYIKSKFIELLKTARKNGFALGICHPLEKTLKVLSENFRLTEEYDLEPVFASQVVR